MTSPYAAASSARRTAPPPTGSWRARAPSSAPAARTSACTGSRAGADGVDTTDNSPDNGIPDYVDLVLGTMEHVHHTYVHAGYRAPKPDRGRGGNNKRDIYLSNLGDQVLYGYCTTDQPSARPAVGRLELLRARQQLHRADRVPDATRPLENMQVTAAHEYFHAVQFAYDVVEDGWLMEATATWAEDELYDDVNDNFQYLKSGQMRQAREGPRRVLRERQLLRQLGRSSATSPSGCRQEQGRHAGPGPRHVAAGRREARAPGQYSLQAIKKVLAGKHRNLGKTYASFAEANRRTHSTYDEGAAERLPDRPALEELHATSRSHRSSGVQSVELDHLTSATAAFTPSGLTGAGWKLRVRADLAPTGDSARAWSIAVFPTSGGVQVANMRLNRAGNGQRSRRLPDRRGRPRRGDARQRQRPLQVRGRSARASAPTPAPGGRRTTTCGRG